MTHPVGNAAPKLPAPTATFHSAQALRLAGATSQLITCRLAEEVPIALLYNGISHVVLMATPQDLDDLATGFSLTEGICVAGEIASIDVRHQDGSIAVDIRLGAPALARFLQDRSQRTTRSHSSCGICGIASIDRLPRPHPTQACAISPVAIRRALAELPVRQIINQHTGAVHAAAWAAPDGTIMIVREDVGRHNALDKLIGARNRFPPLTQDGFCVVTSRCSYEMVQKASAAGMGLLVCISAPTTLAIAQAQQAGLALVAMARADSQTVYVGVDQLTHGAGAEIVA